MSEKTKNQEKTLPSKKPKWMKILEKQSWQAELVISGVAIFGALQLPEALHNFIDFSIYNAPEQILFIVELFILYLAFIVPILIINFILHFVLRALWIGMLGLVSVFPQGINYKFESWSDDYNQKIEKEFPDINQFNKKLDDLCSIMFAGTALGVMMSISISFVGFVLGIIAYAIHHFIPNWNYEIIFLILFSFIAIGGTLQSLLHLKSLRNKKWVQKFHFPIYKTYAKFMFTIFYKPVNYINLTMATHTGMLKSAFYAFIYFFFIALITLMLTRSSNINLLNRHRFHSFQNNPMVWNPNQYLNTFDADSKIFGPVIPSSHISEDEIELFIPRFAREKIMVDSICSSNWTYNDSLSSNENLKLEWHNRIDCHNKYYHIYINDSLLTNLKFYNINHPNKGEKGYVTHLPMNGSKVGENILKVVLGYKYSKKNEQKMYQIPFRYKQKERVLKQLENE